MLMTPQHQVKELRNEAGRNIVGGTMLCSELGRVDVGRYIEKGQRGEEMREEQNGGGVKQRGRGRGKEGEMKGKRGKEVCICIHTYQCCRNF